MRVRFERNVHGRAARLFARFGQRQNLGVADPGSGIKSAPHHRIAGHDHRADARIRAHAPQAARSQIQRVLNVTTVSSFERERPPASSS
jgi:hypothetical protein